MKKNKSYLGFVALGTVLFVSVVVSILFRSNFISLGINLFFTILMFSILLYFMRYLHRFFLLITDLKHGKEYLESISNAKDIDINSVFPSNVKLTNLLKTYYKENAGFDGDIADYINEKTLDDEIHKQTTELAVGAMTGLGLLGTFVGLMWGIKDLNIDQDQLMESIKTLMSGMKTAFLTSIFGVLYSLVFNAIFKDLYSDGLAALDSFYDVFYDKIASNPENRNQKDLDERVAYETELEAQKKRLEENEVRRQEDEKIMIEQEKKINDLIGIKAQIIEDLSQAFSDVDLTVPIDNNTGSITFASSVLFDYNSDKIKATGKEFLDEFLPIYVNSILNEKFKGYISEIIIEGYTDDKGEFIYNLELSQKRAFSVSKYCLEHPQLFDETVDFDHLKAILTTNGKSMNNLIMDDNGTVNAEASRRVEFKFRLKDDEMISEMKNILENKS